LPAGEVQVAAAINTAGTIAQYNDTLVEHLWGPNFKAVAQAKETTVAAGQIRSWLELPPRYAR